MTQITRNFRLREFDPHGDLEEGSELWESMLRHMQHVQRIRDEVGVPVSITPSGGYNGPSTDAARKKRKRGLRGTGSQHRKARATDLVAKGMTPRELYEVILRLIDEGEIPEGGVGLYEGKRNKAKGYVHIDSRGRRARWFDTP